MPGVTVTDIDAKTTTSRMLAHITKSLERKVGMMTSTSSIVIDERLVIKTDISAPRSMCMMLQNPRVDIHNDGSRLWRNPAQKPTI